MPFSDKIKKIEQSFQEVQDKKSQIIVETKAKNADYIERLADQDPGIFTAGVTFGDNEIGIFGSEDHQATKVTIQSVSKLFADLLACQKNPRLLDRLVAREKTDLAFNTPANRLFSTFERTIPRLLEYPNRASSALKSVLKVDSRLAHWEKDELYFDKAFNPSVNYGAILTVYASLAGSGILESEPLDRTKATQEQADLLAKPVIELLLRMMETKAGKPTDIHIDLKTFISELEGAENNRALIEQMKKHQLIPESVHSETLLQIYTANCSIHMDVNQLTQVATTLANRGLNKSTQKIVMHPEIVDKVLNTIKGTGLYNGTEEFHAVAGEEVCAKSGVGGVILGIYPGQGALVTISPPLDKKGNSVVGAAMFECVHKNKVFQPSTPKELYETASMLQSTGSTAYQQSSTLTASHSSIW
ncbi:glutaminase [Piscirickettsia salmonis]|uniref:glutaminase n=1 Tax=Piscirickettsia salmonis TaxID=1238 RepID=UPI003EBCCE05